MASWLGTSTGGAGKERETSISDMLVSSHMGHLACLLDLARQSAGQSFSHFLRNLHLSSAEDPVVVIKIFFTKK